MTPQTRILKEYFGHATFRLGQEQVVDSILQGKDALCVMPTGAGKSLCYQVPALAFDGITLVVSPLIALMKDQVSALVQSGIRAAYLNSSLTAGQYAKALFNMGQGVYKIVYVAPERLASSEFLQTCAKIKISLLAIDEAHCISQWGQDFRPSYLHIADFVARLGYRPIIAAFTATATDQVKADIERSLALRSPLRITTGFDRPNLKFSVLRPQNKQAQLLALLRKHAGESGIIYCSTRKAVESVTADLIETGLGATMYHAGLSAEERRINQEDFVFDRRPIMVATNAFGMGIDKSNVSYVIHYNMPKDIESYYQEAGRAGRDGAKADCILLFSPADVQTAQFLIETGAPNPDLSAKQQALLRARDHQRLKQMTFYATTTACLRAFILRYFGEQAPDSCGNCSNCLTSWQEVDITTDAKKILICIKYTGERFGKKMICDILHGSQNEKIRKFGLDETATWGTLRARKEGQIREIIDHLEQTGFLEAIGNEYPILTLTEKAFRLLNGDETIAMKVESKEILAPKVTRSQVDLEVDPELLAALKALRRKLADERSVPAYVIFTDAALTDMCKKKPQTPEEMLEVSGVGNTKLKQYGMIFLEAIKAYRNDGAK